MISDNKSNLISTFRGDKIRCMKDKCCICEKKNLKTQYKVLQKLLLKQ